MATPARPHRRLVWKYVAVVGTLVAAAIVSVGISEFYFSYEDSKRAVTRVEPDKASSAAISIDQFIQEHPRHLDGVAQPTSETGAAGLAERTRTSSASSTRQRVDQPADATWMRPGRSSVRTSPLEIDKHRQRAPIAPDAPRSSARGPSSGISAASTSSGGSRPHMTIAVAERAPGTRRRSSPTST